jgi:hypothetical protein
MAHPNIDQRRARIKMLLEKGSLLDSKVKNELALEFNCHRSAIEADLVFFQNINTPITIYPSKNLKCRVIDRDNDTCQYCGDRDSLHVVEHVIPAALGGVAREYNLVVACQRCNTIKDRTVWIPPNLYEITSDNPDWREKILLLAKKDESASNNVVRKTVDNDSMQVERIPEKKDHLNCEVEKRQRDQNVHQAQEIKKFEELERKAIEWNRVQIIERYVEALETSLDASLPEEKLMRKKEYIAWAKSKVEWLNLQVTKEE